MNITVTYDPMKFVLVHIGASASHCSAAELDSIAELLSQARDQLDAMASRIEAASGCEPSDGNRDVQPGHAKLLSAVESLITDIAFVAPEYRGEWITGRIEALEEVCKEYRRVSG